MRTTRLKFSHFPVARRMAAVLAAALGIGVAGCGYHISGDAQTDPGYAWHTLYRGDVKTVAVAMFANRTFQQGAEFRLTKAIINQLESQTPYKVAPRERADTLLEGEITSARMRTISRNRVSAVPQEQMYALTVRFTWRDLRDGKILVQRHDFEQTAQFYPTLGEDPFVGEQQNIERLALAIVEELQAEWGIPDQAKK